MRCGRPGSKRCGHERGARRGDFTVSLALYSLVMRVLQPFLRLKLRLRARKEPGYLHAAPERFGYYKPSSVGLMQERRSLLQDAGPLIWMHAVSLGETRTVAVLLQALRRQWPDMRLLLTHSTATGREEGAKLLRSGDRQVWLPWDTSGAALRFLQHFKPDLGVLIETEVWPNLQQACRRQGIPVALVNARMSEKSVKRARKLARLARQAFGALSMVLAQSEQDAQRLRSLGAKVDAVLGNLKFDAEPDVVQLACGREWRDRSLRPLLMFASSREGEEQLLFDALRDRETQPLAGGESDARQAARWLIVPRHPQRFDEVAELIKARGWSLSRVSQWQDGPGEQALACDVWLGDSLGDMALYYGMSDAALLGGSYAPLGGHNLIEAAACACPIVVGPHTYNFAEAAEQALAVGAAFRAASIFEALSRLQSLLGQPEALSQAAQAGQNFSAAHRGCAEKTAAALAGLLRA